MSLSRPLLLGAALVFPVACSKAAGDAPAPAPSASAAQPSVSARRPTISVAPFASASSSARPEVCEVEISGHVRNLPAGKLASIFVSEGDCLAPSASYLGRASSTKEGRFFIEVFSKWGADLTVCAAHEATPGKPTKLYVKAPRTIHAEAEGEIELNGLELPLAEGPPITFAAAASPRPSPKPPRETRP